MAYRQYKPDELRRLQLVTTGILGEFDRICAELKIDYFVYGGTAIGAVRHHGFVPWDDDVDVAMFREDYERFMRAAPKVMGGEYAIFSGRNTPHFPACNANFSLRGTLCVPEEFDGCPFRYPIGIGVFALDRPASNPIRFALQKRLAWLLARLVFLRGTPRPHINVPSPLGGVISGICRLAYTAMKVLHVSPSLLHRLWEKTARMAENENTDVYVDFMDRNPFAWAVTRGEAYPPLRVPFENVTVSLPKEYDTLLTRGFGDYMQLPPKEQRKNHYPSQLDFGGYGAPAAGE